MLNPRSSAPKIGFNLCYFYMSETLAFNDEDGIDPAYYVQLSLRDLDGGGDDEILLFVGDSFVDMELVVFKIDAEALVLWIHFGVRMRCDK